MAYNPDSEIIPTTRSNGVLIANVVPASGLVSGQSSIMMMDGWTWENATLSHPSGLHVNWPQMGTRTGGRFGRSVPIKKQIERRNKSLKALDDMMKESEHMHGYAKLNLGRLKIIIMRICALKV